MSKVLPKMVTKRKKRVGRGYGSGKGGHTVGRGMKGQKSRSKIGVIFEGVKMKKSFIKRLPLRRGKGRFKAKEKPIIINLIYLNLLPSGSKVNLDSLIKHRIVKEKDAKLLGVKILGNGEIKKKLSVYLPTSKSAKKKIEKAGGKVLVEDKKDQRKKSESKVKKNRK